MKQLKKVLIFVKVHVIMNKLNVIMSQNSDLKLCKIDYYAKEWFKTDFCKPI